MAATHRGELVRLAYRVLGSVAEAEDAAQEALLRLEQHGLDGIEQPGAWLARVISRICLDRLRSAQVRRERYVGPWLPEPLLAAANPADGAELTGSVSMALLCVLDALSPAERIAFVLHDVFGYEHADLAATLIRSEAACRQLVSRAGRAVRERRPRFDTDPVQRDAAVRDFLAACRTGQLAPLLETLAPGVELRSDGGGVASAARRPIHGADAVARFCLGLLRKAPASLRIEPATVNGTLGAIVWAADGTPDTVFGFDVVDGRIQAIFGVRNPAKLAHVQPDASPA